MRFSSLLYPCLLLCLYFFSGCKTSDSISEIGGKDRVIFRYPIRTNPASFDPTRSVDVETLNLHHQVLEGLVGMSEKSRPTLRIANKIEVSRGGHVYVFHLRKGVKFSSGNEVHADDFKWTFERNCSPGLIPQTSQFYLGDIVGVPERLAGKAGEIRGIRVLGRYTLEITLKKPRRYFLDKLTHPVASVLDRSVVPANKEITKPSALASAGPFSIKQYIPNQVIQLAANPYYYAGVPLTKCIEIPIIKDVRVCLDKYKLGELDLTYVQSQDVPALQRDRVYKSELKVSPTASVLYLSLNPEMYSPFRDIRVRRAILQAINRENIVQDVMKGVHLPAYSLIPSSVPGYQNPRLTPAYHPSMGRNLLRKAGYPDSSRMSTLFLYLVDQSPSAHRCAEAIARQITTNLGIPVQLKKMDLGKLYQKHSRKELGMALIGWKPTYADPENFLSVLLSSTSSLNYSGYKNPTFDRLCRKADSLMDQRERLCLYAQAEKIALQDVALIPIYFFSDVELISPRVTGLRRSLFGHLPYTSVVVK